MPPSKLRQIILWLDRNTTDPYIQYKIAIWMNCIGHPKQLKKYESDILQTAKEFKGERNNGVCKIGK